MPNPLAQVVSHWRRLPPACVQSESKGGMALVPLISQNDCIRLTRVIPVRSKRTYRAKEINTVSVSWIVANREGCRGTFGIDVGKEDLFVMLWWLPIDGCTRSFIHHLPQFQRQLIRGVNNPGSPSIVHPSSSIVHPFPFPTRNVCHSLQ